MIFWDIFLSGIMGAAAFLQAESGGWKLFAAALGLLALGFVATVALIASDGGMNIGAILAGPDELKIKALAFLPFLGVVLVIGTVSGALLRGRLTPGRAGVATSIGGYLSLNVIYYYFLFGAFK